jgi:hypothetical protein
MGDRPLFPKLSFFFLIHSKTWSVPFYTFYTFYTFYIFLFLNSSFIYSQVPEVEATLLHEFNSLDARQGVAVNATHVFSINNSSITMHDKSAGESVLQWAGEPNADGEKLIHLDSGMVKDGLLYTAHSNYPDSPMSSSIEILNANTLEYVDSFSFGVLLGSLTWLDFHQDHWWATFANYDLVHPGESQPYGTTAATTLVKMDNEFNILQQWLFPEILHSRFTPMSNSGGSWGADGFLYITGHDHPEVYVLQIPELGSEVHWLATVKVPWIEGQGIAWDRTTESRVMWGISRSEEKVFSFSIPDILQP